MGKAILSIPSSPGEQDCWTASSQLSGWLPALHLAPAHAAIFSSSLRLTDQVVMPSSPSTTQPPPLDLSQHAWLPAMCLQGAGLGRRRGSKTTETLGPRPCPSAQGMGWGTPGRLDGEFPHGILHSAGAMPCVGHAPQVPDYHTGNTARQRRDTGRTHGGDR